MTRHVYTAKLTWTGNCGEGTTHYQAFSRDYDIACEGKPIVKGSSDPNYLGDATRHNPEDLLLASLSACHMLWYLHLCAVNKVVVTDYEDHPEGVMEVVSGSSGRFTEVTLRPRVTIGSGSDAAKAESLHETANAQCFVANSVNFPVRHEAAVVVDKLP